MGLHQTKKLPHNKGNNKCKRQPTEWKEILENYSSNRGLISRIHKDSNNSVEKSKITILKWHMSHIDICQKEDIKKGKYMKTCSTLLITREMQIRVTRRYHLSPVEKLFSKKKQNIINAGGDAEKEC
jgi:hypothetical protein